MFVRWLFREGYEKVLLEIENILYFVFSGGYTAYIVDVCEKHPNL